MRCIEGSAFPQTRFRDSRERGARRSALGQPIFHRSTGTNLSFSRGLRRTSRNYGVCELPLREPFNRRTFAGSPERRWNMLTMSLSRSLVLSRAFTPTSREKLMLLSRGKSPPSLVLFPSAGLRHVPTKLARLVHYPARRVFRFCAAWK